LTTAVHVPRPSRNLSFPNDASLDRFGARNRSHPIASVLWAVMTGCCMRLTVVALLYKGFLDPTRDHWEFAYEMGRVARSIALKHGYANPYWAETGPTALLTPVYPYLLAGIFAIFGVYTKASALVFLSLNSFISAVTSVPIFLIARRSFDLRTANLAAWVWAFFPYAINFSAATMWYHSFVALLLALLFLLVLSLESSDSPFRWAGFGTLLGFAALTNPVLVGVSPLLFGWSWVRLRQQHKRAWGAISIGLVAMVVTILPWVVRNKLVLGHPIPFKDGFWLEVCVGNVNNTMHWWDGEEHPSGSVRESAKFERLGELRYMAAKRQEALTYIHQHPETYALRTFRHVVFMWTGFWSFHREYLREEPFDPENVCFLSLLSVMSLTGLYRMLRKDYSEVGILYLLVLLVFPVPYYLSHVDPGFRHPVDPLLVILGSSMITRSLPRSRTANGIKLDAGDIRNLNRCRRSSSDRCREGSQCSKASGLRSD
jgi:4-amino-4-deoxy-L-arabinose transferase-like glycosyltransferase